MTKQDAGLLTMRALAIYAVIRALEQIGKSLQYGSEETSTILKIFDLGQLYAPSVILLVCSAVLWFMAPSIVVKVFGTSSNLETSKTSSSDIRPLVYSSIGLFILIEAIPELIKLFFVIFATVAFESESKMQTQRNYLIIVTIFKLGIGTWLVLGTKGVTHAIQKLRRD